jgi:hypothetical protein
MTREKRCGPALVGNPREERLCPLRTAEENRLADSGKACRYRGVAQESILIMNNIKELKDKRCPVPRKLKAFERTGKAESGPISARFYVSAKR